MSELICSTSVLSALHQVNLRSILPVLSAVVIVPAAVDGELAAGRSSGHNVPDTAALSWAVVRTPSIRVAASV